MLMNVASWPRLHGEMDWTYARLSFGCCRFDDYAKLKPHMKFGVLVFPGSNCDHDAYYSIESAAKQPVTFLWHASHDRELRRHRRSGRLCLWRLPAHRRNCKVCANHAGGQPLCRERRTRARHLQWLPDSLRSWTATGSAAAQCGAQIHLQAGESAR